MALARQEITINAPPTTVWSLIGDVTKWPSWHGRITSGRMLEGDEFFPGATFQFTYDGKPLVGTIIHIERPKRVAWRCGNTRQSVRLEGLGTQTKVSAEREVTGFMASLRKGKAQQEAAQSLKEWLEALKAAAEKAPKSA